MLHTPTLFLVIIVVNLMTAAAIAFIAFRRHRNLFLWASALALQGVAYVLFSQRGHIGDGLSIVGGNLALSAAFALLGEGVYQFQRRAPPRWLLWLPVAGVTVSFAWLIDDLHNRLLVGGVVFPLQCLLVLVAVLQRRHATPGRGQYLLAAGCLAVIAVMGLRILALATGQLQIGSFAESSPMQAGTFLASVIGTLWLSIGLLMMNQERAEQALREGQAQERLRGQVLELIADGQPLRTILGAIVMGIEQQHPGMLCSVLLLDRQGLRLGDGVAPSLPDEWNAAIEGLAIGPGVGACGTAAYTGQRVVVPRIAGHPDWPAPFQALAAKAGLVACWSQPILSSSHRVLGTFAIYHRTAHTPSAAHVVLIEQTAQLAGIAIERHHAAAALRRSEARYRLLVEMADEGICVVQDGLLRFVNPKLCALLGYSAAELLGRPTLDFILADEDGPARPAQPPQRLQGTAGTKLPLRLLTRQQGPRWFEISGARFDWEGQPATLNFLTDITDRRLSEQRVQQMAYHDALTQLPNRRLLTEHLKLAMARHRRSGRHGALMFMDLDNFKPLNDTHGHELGDQLLVEVARRLNTQVRQDDTVARFGGDEFVVLLGDLDRHEPTSRLQAAAVAEKIRIALAAPYRLRKPVLGGADSVIEHRCSASIGIVLFLDQSGSEEALIAQADAAMYEAKRAGRNTVDFFEPTR